MKTLYKQCKRCKKQFNKPVNCSLKEWENVRKYCSRDCASPKNPAKKCLECGKTFQRSHKQEKRCSRECYYNSKRGKEPWNKGKTKEEDSRIAQPWLGKKRKPETMEKIAKTLRKPRVKCKECKKVLTNRRCTFCQDCYKGKNTFLWKGGIYPKHLAIRQSPEYKKWRKLVFERDNYTCQICNIKGVELNADHIKPFSTYPELRTKLSNGRTLCVPCHRKTDTYGIKAIKLKKIN
jgi:hypothetical protein